MLRNAAIWGGIAAIALVVIAMRLEITVDLAYFLPSPSNQQEGALIDRLGQGPGSQMIFISVPVSGGNGASVSGKEIASSLGRTGLFGRVIGPYQDFDKADIPGYIWRNRYLLTDVDLSVNGLRDAQNDRLADMAAVSDDAFLDIAAADPYLASLVVVEALVRPTSGFRPAGPDDEALFLIAETIEPAFAIAAQTRAVAEIRSIVFEAVGRLPELHGVGVYSVELQNVIQREVATRSVLAALAIALVLLVSYRRVRILWLASIPLFIGSLIGLATVAALFGKIHGITLAFGFTLFGVAIDYPLHLFSHLRHGAGDGDDSRQKMRVIWPTLRLGVTSTVIAYLAFTVSGSLGLAQLGLFSAAGILAAALVTRTLLPDMMRVRESVPASGPAPRTRYLHWVWVIGLGAGASILAALPNPIWTNDMSAMMPIAPEKLERDWELRQALGAPDIRYLITIEGSSPEDVLLKAESLAPVLAGFRGEGSLNDFWSVTSLLPSRATLDRRMTEILAAANNPNLIEQATQDSLFRSASFVEFKEDLQDMANRSVSVSEQLIDDATGDSMVRSMIDGGLYKSGDRWVSVITLFGLRDPDGLAELLRTGGVSGSLVDLKGASESLVRSYRQRVFLLSGIVILIILFFLLWRVRFGPRLLWITGTLAAAVLVTLAGTTLLLGSLSLFSLFATILVFGLGLDYALFFSRSETTRGGLIATRHAVTTCAVSTGIAFIVLALSSVPILTAIGTTVAIGTLANFFLARFGLRHY